MSDIKYGTLDEEIQELEASAAKKDEENTENPEKSPKSKINKFRIISLILVITMLSSGAIVLIKHSHKGAIKPVSTPTVSTGTPDDDDTEITILEYNDVVNDFLTTISNNNLVVTDYDVEKFVSIVNIDELVDTMPDVASQMFTTNSEEYLNDAAKVIGAIVMHNYQVYTETGKTTDFIKVSDSVVGKQKEYVLCVEEYTNMIAEAASNNDEELVNELVLELISELNSGKLSKLDDGVGFGISVNIALISDVIARNYLNQENFDMLNILKTSEKYVSNILTVYEGCITDSKVLTK